MTTPDPLPPWTVAAVNAVTEAVEHEHDFGGWLSVVLAYAAARCGSAVALTAGRPGSWEAAHVNDLAAGLILDAEGLAWFAEDWARRGGESGRSPT